MRKPAKRTSLRKGAVCGVCKHQDRALIEATRVAGASLDSIAGKYKISRDAVWRHTTNHVPEDVRLQYITSIPIKELAERAANEGVTLLDYFSIVRGVLLQQFQLAASVNDKNGTAVLAGRLTESSARDRQDHWRVNALGAGAEHPHQLHLREFAGFCEPTADADPTAGRSS